ncbi:MAG: hypothetical protein Q8S54_04530 [Bacteroidota bacterium]|nr:hypothetical protein [Odoribacter sp.]MDP3642440.1 hypothetical protein [Bacteroidota bacterium]
MTLNTNIISLIITGCLSAMLMTSCGPPKQKPDDAFDRVKKVRMLSNDSNFVSEEIIQESMKTEPVKKNENLDAWTKFKIETENKIHQNENKIKEIKGLPGANASMLRKLANLEKDNNGLRIKMDTYQEEVKVKWKMFQASMNHNVNEIDIELNAIKADNKK